MDLESHTHFAVEGLVICLTMDFDTSSVQYNTKIVMLISLFKK